MKRIKYYILITILFFSFFTYVNATTCTYSDGKLTVTFEVVAKKNTTKAKRATVNGTMISEGKLKEIKQTQSIENWDSMFQPGFNPDEPKKINAKGADYYKNNGKCPPFAILVDRNGQYDLAVFSESHRNEFEKYGSAKQGYSIMNLTEEKRPETDGNDTNHIGTSCLEYTSQQSCEQNGTFSCVWNEDNSLKNGGYCNTDKLQYVLCGDAFDIPHEIPEIFSLLVNLLKIATPIILIVVSIISLLKGLGSSSEDEIKKAQKAFVKKIVASIMVFLVISIVQFVTMKIADNYKPSQNENSEAENLSECLTCFLNNDCEDTIYYKTKIAGTYNCTYVKSGKSFLCKDNK